MARRESTRGVVCFVSDHVTHWWVATPEYDVVEPILDDGSGPIVTVFDFVSVAAATKRQALVEGARKLRAEKSVWLRDHDGSPFAGLVATPAVCAHGVCFCDLDDCLVCECPDCERECAEREPQDLDYATQIAGCAS